MPILEVVQVHEVNDEWLLQWARMPILKDVWHRVS